MKPESDGDIIAVVEGISNFPEHYRFYGNRNVNYETIALVTQQ